MSKRNSGITVRMEDPKAQAKPDLSYGGSSLSVEVDEDTRGFPTRLTVTCEVELPEATVKRKLNQDLLAAARITGEAKKYLAAREDFFKEQIRIRMQTKNCKQEAGFLTGQLSPQNKKDWDWKEFAVEQTAKLIKIQKKVSMARARVLAEVEVKKKYEKAPEKETKDKVAVKGVIQDA